MSVTDTFFDPYSVLRVPIGASLEELKKSWRQLSRELHPDRNPASDAAEQFRQVQKAWEILSDPNRRARCDAILRGKAVRDPEKLIATLVQAYLGGF